MTYTHASLCLPAGPARLILVEGPADNVGSEIPLALHTAAPYSVDSCLHGVRAPSLYVPRPPVFVFKLDFLSWGMPGGRSSWDGRSEGAGRGERLLGAPCTGPTVKTEEVEGGLRRSREPVIAPEQGKNRAEVLFLETRV